MCRKGENIRKRKDGRWEARYIKWRDADGKIHYGSLYGKSYNEVKEKRRKKMQKHPHMVCLCKFCSNGTPILKLAVHPF